MKRSFCLLLVLALTLTMTACKRQTTPTHTAQTLPDAPALYDAPHGVDGLAYDATVALYLPSRDKQRLLAQYVTLPLNRSRHSAQAVAAALLAYPGNDAVQPLGGDVSVALYGTNPVEVSAGVCTVNLTSSALRLSSQDFYTLCMGLASTLCQLEDVSYVNVLVANQPVGLDVAGYLPLGTLTAHPGEALTALWEQIYSRRTPLGRDPAQTFLNSAATLYFPLRDGTGLMAETRNLTFEGQTPAMLAEGLLDALFAGALYMDDACSLAELAGLMAAKPEASELADGSRMITLYFLPDLFTRLRSHEIDPGCFMGALTYTITGFIPSVTAVRVQSGATLITTVNSQATGTLHFQNGIQRRSQYQNALRERVSFCLVKDGMLQTVERSAPSASARDPRTLLGLVLEGPTQAEARLGYSAAAPLGYHAADVLGVSMVGDTLLVNVSERFSDAVRAQTMDEQLLCYSMVNTLCEAMNARRVRFYFAGDMEQTMGGKLWWGGEFLFNRMLIRH